MIAEKEINDLAELLGVSRDEALKLAIKEGIKELRLRKAIELYVTGKKSLKQAARIAGVSLAEWFEITKEKGLLVQISPEEVEEELEALSDWRNNPSSGKSYRKGYSYTTDCFCG